MEIQLFDMNKFIEKNELPEVTTPILFDANGNPNSQGLFSYELFGVPNSYDRKTLFGYIDLKRKFLHPMVYKNLVALDKRMVKIVSGEVSYKITPDGQLVEDPNGETGLDFLYKNLKKMNFRRSKSVQRANRLKIIDNAYIDELFLDKFLVTPPFYRDFNAAKAGEGKTSYDDINRQYSKLVNYASSISSGDNIGISFMSHVTENRIQLLLVEIYDELIGTLPGKKGYIRKHLMGKAIDYAARGVITAPPFKGGSWKNQLVPFGYTGVPLSMATALFNGHISYEIRNYLQSKVKGRFIDSVDSKGNLVEVPVDDFVLEKFTPDYIQKNIMELYIQGIPDRFNPITVEDEDGNEIPIALNQDGKYREMTVIDLLFITAKRAIADKLHVWVTRYPVTSYQSAYPSKVVPLTTHKVVDTVVDGIHYTDYPQYLSPEQVKKEDSSLYYDSIIVGNLVLDALGGDYDGDTVSLRGVYSQEANEEANDIMMSKKNLLNLSGGSIRVLINEGVQTLFGLTR